MKRILTVLIGLFLGMLTFAQDLVLVRGSVTDENGKPLSGASIVAVGTKMTFKTSDSGAFEVKIPSTVNYLQIKKPGYVSKNTKVSSFIRVSLQKDVAAQKASDEDAAAQKAAAEKAAAEKAAAEKAAAAQKANTQKTATEKTSAQKAAEQAAAAKAAAEKEAAAKAAAEQAAAEKAAAEKAAAEQAEAARLAAEKAAAEKAELERKAEEARLAAEQAEAARLAAEKAAAEEMARLRAEKEAAEQEAARIAAEKVAAEAAAAHDKKARHGFQHTLGVSYYLAGQQTLTYFNVGPRSFLVHPVMVDYILGYRFNAGFSVGVGVGYFRYLQDFQIENEYYQDINGRNFSDLNYALPVSLNLKYAMGKKKVHPFVSAAAALNVTDPKEITVDAGGGIEIREGYRSGLQFQVSFATLPYFGTGSVRFKVGYMF